MADRIITARELAAALATWGDVPVGIDYDGDLTVTIHNIEVTLLSASPQKDEPRSNPTITAEPKITGLRLPRLTAGETIAADSLATDLLAGRGI